jgi:hypothetical protein
MMIIELVWSKSSIPTTNGSLIFHNYLPHSMGRGRSFEMTPSLDLILPLETHGLFTSLPELSWSIGCSP